MKDETSKRGILAAILKKDIILLKRDLLFIFISILSITSFVVLYWVLPKNVNETISLGVRGGELKAVLEHLAGMELDDVEGEGLGLSWYETTEELKTAVEKKELQAGIDFPDSFFKDASAGKPVKVTIFARPNLPVELRGALTSMVREITYALTGNVLPVSEPEEETVILGIDRAGAQIPFREKMKPLYAFLVLVMEAVALGALIATEIQQKTITALLVTKARLGDVLAAKLILGSAIAFSEAALVLVLVRGFGSSPLIVITALVLGAIMVAGISMIAGSAGKDLLGTMLIAMLFLFPLMIPAFSVLFPGTAAPWIRILPSYGLVQTILNVTLENGGWAESAGSLLMLAGWGFVFAALGLLVLKRRVETL